ncbi:MAG: DUF1192 domain-containing protein [Alphaproteobacteria bacterium]|nr:DUF1192 domain-containing protein [Alphaproteobacteria bacterium]MCD8520252.1 DUF1192 domain-containing protein [Alphaproteobacteria bacterium]MCD8570320.1 DUF1192 domain-containing protein [Alphaproteobacteria bacterium]
MFDDLEPIRKKKEYTLGEKLDQYSVAELEALISELKAEIERAEADISKKKASTAAAEALFKS